MNHKFLKDGRKVVVVGKINSTEYIVQEIFVNPQGDEIPSGEKFTTKSLLDEKLVSYREQNLKNVTEKLERIEKEIKEKTSQLKLISTKAEGYKKLSKSLNDIEKNFNSEHLKTLKLFLDNKINYTVIQKYSGYEIKTLEAFLDIDKGYYGSPSFDGIKLLTLFGRSDGNLEFRLNRYGDGSGTNYNVEFFETIDQAKNYIKKQFENLDSINITQIEKMLELGIHLDLSKEIYQNAFKKKIHDIKENVKEQKHLHNEKIEKQLEIIKNIKKRII